MGREAFDPNTSPMDVQPFDSNSWWYESNLSNWLDGWYEAAATSFNNIREDKEVCSHCGKEL